MGAACAIEVVGSKVILTGMTVALRSDVTITLTEITNPSTPGEYGPFSIASRHSRYGQVLAMNRTFATVQISAAPTTMKHLSVDLTGSNLNRAVGSTNQSLKFTMTPTAEIWKYDVFQITLDTHWGIDKTTVKCRSASV
jgi:hypothetical protein